MPAANRALEPKRAYLLIFVATFVMINLEILFPRCLKLKSETLDVLIIMPMAYLGLAIGGVFVLFRNRLSNISLMMSILP